LTVRKNCRYERIKWQVVRKFSLNRVLHIW
jgi:hypothetical protein